MVIIAALLSEATGNDPHYLKGGTPILRVAIETP